MQIPLKIAFEGVEPTESLRARIELEAEKLERYSGRILSGRVSLLGRSGRRHKGDLYGVRIHLALPGRDDVVVDRNPPADHSHEDVYVAIRDAFDAARRQLEDHERRFSGRTKHHEAPPQGRVARLFREQGYGFIETDDGREVYFHRNAAPDDGFDRLAPGMKVRFVEVEGDKGPQASTVQALG